MTMVNARSGQVRRAQQALRRGGDTRALKRELQAGNHYAVALLHARGLAYIRGSGIVRVRQVDAGP